MNHARRPELSEVFFALSDPTRLQVVRLLGVQAQRASDLAESLGTSRPGMSRHLRILRAARVVYEEVDPEDARARLVAVDPAALDQIQHFLQEVSCEWEARLDAFRVLAEGRAQDKNQSKKKTKLAS